MIGQLSNIACIDHMVDTDTLSRFFIIVGSSGSGRKTLAHHLVKKLGAYEVFPGNTAENVRDTITCSYKCDHPTVYIFPEADKMSPQAKNSLLKVTEEPPKQAYFVLTILNIGNMLPTLVSRGTSIYMAPYTATDLELFVASINDEQLKGKKLVDIIKLSDTPGHILQLREIDLDPFIAFCDSVLDNIGTVTGVNALKIGQRLSFKEDTPGYDPALFFNCISKRVLERLYNNSVSIVETRYLTDALLCCAKYTRELSLTGVRKDATFDMWILDMRDIWKEHNK